MSVLSKPFGDSIQQSQYNYCLLTSSFPSSDKLFLLMMDTMIFLSNPLMTTILHCKPTLLLLLLCISILVGHALCIQTTFIVPHPWKYLISIFFLFILGAAALFTTNCKNYMSSAKNYTTSDKSLSSQLLLQECTDQCLLLLLYSSCRCSIYNKLQELHELS